MTKQNLQKMFKAIDNGKIVKIANKRGDVGQVWRNRKGSEGGLTMIHDLSSKWPDKCTLGHSTNEGMADYLGRHEMYITEIVDR